MAVSESQVLHFHPSGSYSPDDWPVFGLKETCISSQKTDEIVSLLSANKENSVRVTGRLRNVDRGLGHLVKDRNYSNVTIEVRDVTSYAFAEYEDGSFGFWAAGGAGWYEIEEVIPAYSTVFDEMSVATAMLYFVADKLRRSRKFDFTLGEFEKHIRRLFKDFWLNGKYQSYFSDIKDVQNAFDSHRAFLIASMFEGQEDINWKDALLLKYFEAKFPDDVIRIKARILGGDTRSEQSSKVVEQLRYSSVPPFSDQKRRRGRPPKILQMQLSRSPPGEVHRSSSLSDDGEDNKAPIDPRKRRSILQPSGGRFSKKARKSHGSRKYNSPSACTDELSGDEIRVAASPEEPIETICSGQQLLSTSKCEAGHQWQSSSTAPEYLPRKFFELRVAEYDIHTSEPQGLGKQWVCPIEGCKKQVYLASASEGESKLREHLRVHQSSASDRISLALDESRPYLPVNNLVRRLQAIKSSPGEGHHDDPQWKYVAPVRKKY